jgi:hypothetical protein
MADNKLLQQMRVREMAEVFTPSWVCNAQNNLIDNAWLEKDNLFNYEKIDEKGKRVIGKRVIDADGKSVPRTGELTKNQDGSFVSKDKVDCFLYYSTPTSAVYSPLKFVEITFSKKGVKSTKQLFVTRKLLGKIEELREKYENSLILFPSSISITDWILGAQEEPKSQIVTPENSDVFGELSPIESDSDSDDDLGELEPIFGEKKKGGNLKRRKYHKKSKKIRPRKSHKKSKRNKKTRKPRRHRR